jgi:hypothetical protein
MATFMASDALEAIGRWLWPQWQNFHPSINKCSQRSCSTGHGQVLLGLFGSSKKSIDAPVITHATIRGKFAGQMVICFLLLALHTPVLATQLEVIHFESRVLKDSPLHDPALRSVAVFLPSQADFGAQLFPSSRRSFRQLQTARDGTCRQGCQRSR